MRAVGSETGLGEAGPFESPAISVAAAAMSGPNLRVGSSKACGFSTFLDTESMTRATP